MREGRAGHRQVELLAQRLEVLLTEYRVAHLNLKAQARRGREGTVASGSGEGGEVVDAEGRKVHASYDEVELDPVVCRHVDRVAVLFELFVDQPQLVAHRAVPEHLCRRLFVGISLAKQVVVVRSAFLLLFEEY